ncbi:MAG: M23 family metallopeptidase [Oligoflexia bacterium]|nr:M23 family metallopeptidase [Oligoflexia bacterium]
MNRYYTIMLVPERGKKVISFKMPRILLQSLFFILALITITFSILIYDYKQILNQLYENKYLTIENHKLRGQLNIFQMKLNSMGDDLQRIFIFEKKLRIITGSNNLRGNKIIGKEQNSVNGPSDSTEYGSEYNQDSNQDSNQNSNQETNQGANQGLNQDSTKSNDRMKVTTLEESFDKNSYNIKTSLEKFENKKEFIKLKNLYYDQLVQELNIPKNEFLSLNISRLATHNAHLSSAFAGFDYKFNVLKKVSEKLEKEINYLDRFLLDKESLLKSTPSLLPSEGWITSFFGVRQSPYSGRPKIHEGLDVGAPTGTTIIAPADGIITYSGHKPGLGKFIQVDHGYGLETIYAHANALLVNYGQKIKRGDIIAQVGNTGNSTGPHLHYEVRVNGVAVDPLYFVLD